MQGKRTNGSSAYASVATSHKNDFAGQIRDLFGRVEVHSGRTRSQGKGPGVVRGEVVRRSYEERARARARREMEWIDMIIVA